MNFPEDIRYSDEHEWARWDPGTKIVTVGVTDYAQEKMGDVVYVELPDEGDEIEKGEPFGSVESVKAVSDLYAPVTGKVMEVNDALLDSPEIVNEDAYGEAWMVRVKVDGPAEWKELMDADAYKKFVAKEEEEEG
jgi:glycine cleavage system H protein